jgi:hypothetical protein
MVGGILVALTIFRLSPVITYLSFVFLANLMCVIFLMFSYLRLYMSYIVVFTIKISIRITKKSMCSHLREFSRPFCSIFTTI